MTIDGQSIAGNGGFIAEGKLFLNGDIISYFRGDIINDNYTVPSAQRGYIVRISATEYLAAAYIFINYIVLFI